jgi:hypothetical protein
MNLPAQTIRQPLDPPPGLQSTPQPPTPLFPLTPKRQEFLGRILRRILRVNSDRIGPQWQPLTKQISELRHVERLVREPKGPVIAHLARRMQKSRNGRAAEA